LGLISTPGHHLCLACWPGSPVRRPEPKAPLTPIDPAILANSIRHPDRPAPRPRPRSRGSAGNPVGNPVAVAGPCGTALVGRVTRLDLRRCFKAALAGQALGDDCFAVRTDCNPAMVAEHRSDPDDRLASFPRLPRLLAMVSGPGRGGQPRAAHICGVQCRSASGGYWC